MKLTSQTLDLGNTRCTHYTLSSDSGIQIGILSYGATITKITTPDRYGNFANIVLSFQDPNDYLHNSLYAGAILAPTAGRISNGQLPINDPLSNSSHSYTLTTNDGSHHIHGGSNCASFQNWEYVSSFEHADEVQVSLRLTLPTGLDGYPANRTIIASYTLTNDNTFQISYLGTSDSETYMNLSNHSYFNLSGDFSKDCYQQELTIASDYYVANNKEHLPLGLFPVKDTPFDYRHNTSLSQQMAQYPNDIQIQNALGYNNAFLLSSTPRTPALRLSDPNSGRKMTLYTNAPSIVLYSGGYIDQTSILANNTTGCAGCALAIEPQALPDAPNHPDFSPEYTGVGDVSMRTICYCFDTYI